MPPDLSHLRPTNRGRLADQVYESLEEAILSGKMRPGDHLIETWIAEQLGVSRTTVREALLRLERQGYVVNEPRRGTFVTRLAQADALDLCYTRALLESFAVSIGYARIGARLLLGMEACLAQMRRFRLPDDLPRLVQVDLAFHRPLVEAAESPRLTDLWASLNGQIGALVLRSVEEQHATIGDVVTFHETLLAAIRSGDAQAAQQGVIAHYVRTDERETVRHSILHLNALLAPAHQHDFHPVV